MAAAAFVTDLTEILTQAAEAAAGVAGILNSFKILDLQRKYYDLYSQQREFYYNVFQQGVEKPLAEETYAEVPYEYDYEARVAELADSVFGPFEGRIGDTQAWWERHASYYGAPLDEQLERELPFDLARIKSDWTNYMLRFEEHYYDVVNDRRWQRRFAIHNIGIKQGTAIAGALDNSLGVYTDHLTDFGNQLATYANGAAKYVGYKKGLADTSDAFTSMDYTSQVNIPDPYKTASNPYKALSSQPSFIGPR